MKPEKTEDLTDGYWWIWIEPENTKQQPGWCLYSIGRDLGTTAYAYCCGDEVGATVEMKGESVVLVCTMYGRSTGRVLKAVPIGVPETPAKPRPRPHEPVELD